MPSSASEDTYHYRFCSSNFISELDPALTLAPQHQDLARLATGIAAFLHERFAHLQIDSGVKTFLSLPNTYGWEVKQKLVWLGQHSYLLRLNFTNYVHAHGGIPDIPTIDDFVCQATTGWSGLGAIDLLAALLDLTAEQRATLRRWYERHAAYFRVLAVHEPFLEVVNLLTDHPYTIRVEAEARQFPVGKLVFGSVVPWEGAWYWSGVQRGFATVTDDSIERIRKDFPLQAPHIVSRYNEPLAEKAREIVSTHYQQFIAYYGTDLVRYPDGHALEQPAGGQRRAANALAERVMPLSAAGVRWVWERKGRENLNKRRRAVAAKVARASPILTEAQLAALEKAKVDKEAQGEVESEGPGSCGAPDTFSVGTLKGVGRSSQQPFLATDSQVGFAQL